MSSIVKYLLVLVTLAQSCGCSVWWIPQVKDLQFVSVQLVDMKNEKIFNPLNLSLSVPTGQVLKVQFATFSDLGAISLEHELNLWAEAVFCASGTHLSMSPAVYYHDIHVSQLKRNSPEHIRYTGYRSEEKASEPYIYHVYVDYRNDRPRSLKDDYRIGVYDLSKESQDVCTLIRGGNMLGGTLRANTITIPKDKISKALK